MGLWQLKTELREGRMNFKFVFVKIFKFSESRIFWSSLFHSITTGRKKKFWKKLCFSLNRGIILVFLWLYVITEVEVILNGYWYLKILKEQHSFQYHLLFSRISKPSSLYSFSLEVPFLTSIIANVALCWIDPSFQWDVVLHGEGYHSKMD